MRVHKPTDNITTDCSGPFRVRRQRGCMAPDEVAGSSAEDVVVETRGLYRESTLGRRRTVPMAHVTKMGELILEAEREVGVKYR